MENFKRYGLWALAGIGVMAIICFIYISGRDVIYEFSASTSSYGSPVTMLSGMAEAESMMAFDQSGDYGGNTSVRSGKSVTMGDGTVVDPKIIKTGSLELVVDDVDETSDNIGLIATANDGYVERQNAYEGTDGTRYASVTIRVPVENFITTMEGVKGYANVVESESVGADDVTEDYVDVLARLNNAKSQEERYLAILTRADTVEDILSVERELTVTRELVERYQGQINYLDSQTSLSTITISLSEEPTVEIAGKTFRPGTTVLLAAAALVALAQGFVNSIIWLVIVGGGIGIPVALIVWIIVKWKRSRR
jgi:hypothetical protein